MIFGADYLIFIIFVLLFFLGITGKLTDRRTCIAGIITILISLLVIRLIHFFIDIPRPFVSFPITPLIGHSKDASFPSTHTSVIAAIAFTFIFFKSKLTPFLFLAVLWIGFARIFVGVHFPVDILGGILVGLASALLVFLFFRKSLDGKNVGRGSK